MCIRDSIIILGQKKDIPNTKNFSKKVIAYEDLIENISILNEWPIFSEKTASSLCYTSGTTGKPKGVLYSHRSTLIHTLAAANPDSFNLSCLDVIMPIAPMFHANAWGIPYVATMIGAKLVLPGRHLDGKSIYNFNGEREGNFYCCCSNNLANAISIFRNRKKEAKSFEKLRYRWVCVSKSNDRKFC